jgi:hypothetical protein
MTYIKAAYPCIFLQKSVYQLANFIGTDVEDHIFISDREKCIAIAVEQCFPQALHLHCCQHIADNLQQRFGNKVRPLFGL